MKSSFSFNLRTHIEFGEGLLKKTGSLTRNMMMADKALIVTDKGIRGTGMADVVHRSLKAEGFHCEWFDHVESNPTDMVCEEGGEIARQFGAEVIIATGGGSVIDAAKAIALLQTHEGSIQDYEGNGKANHKTTPIVAIPTTAGTGSEVTYSSVISDTKRNIKMTIKDEKLAPTLAIVDPETTYKLPENITAFTGIDAFVHAIEAYTSKLANPFSNMMAEEAMKRIFPSLPSAVQRGGREERYQMMLGALMAGIAFSHSDVAAMHCMGEAVGGLYNTPHGIATGMFLPVIIEYNAEQDPVKYAHIAKICGLSTDGLDDKAASELLVKELQELTEQIGIPKFNSLAYVNASDFPYLSEIAYLNGSTSSNCRKIEKDDFLRLFQKTLG